MKTLLALSPVRLPPTNAPTNVNSAPKTNTNSTPNPKTNSNSGGTTTQIDIPSIINPFGDKANTVNGIANRGINVLLGLIVIASVIVIIISGFRMLTGGSNPDQLKKAKTGIVWAIIGLLVAFMSFAVVSIVQSLL